MTKVIVDDTDLDVYPDTVVQTTLKALDIGDLSKRFVAFTNTLKLPLTEKNQRAYGISQLRQSASAIPYTRRSCKIVHEGIEIISNGQEKVSKIGNEITTTIYGNTFDFFEKIKEKMLYEINLTSINPTWRDASIAGFCNVTTGVVAPVMDYGDFNQTTGDINTGTYLPSIYYHTIIQQIFADAGYTISGAILSNNRYLKLIQPFSRDKFEFATGVLEKYRFLATKTVTQNLTNPVNVQITFPNETLDTNLNYDTGTSTYTTNAQIGVMMHFYAELECFAAGGGTNFTFEIVANGSVVATSVFPNGSGSNYIKLDSKILNPNGVPMPGDSRTAIVRVNGTNAVASGVNAGKFYNEPSYIPLTETGSGERRIPIAYLLPEVSQTDYIKDFFFRFGLIPYESNGNIVLKSINEIITNVFDAIDLTNKAVRKVSEISFQPLSYGYINKLFYQKPDDVPNENLGIGQFTLSNFPNLQAKTLYTTFFSSSQSANISLQTDRYGIYAAIIPVYDRSAPPAVRTKFANEPGIRILIVRDKRANEPNVLYNGVSQSAYKVAYFDDVEEALSCNFQKSIDSDYSLLATALNTAKIEKKEYNLDAVDVSKITPHTLIFDTDSYYIINSLKFTAGQISDVELFKVA